MAPSELEAILLQHPAVRDAAVVGTPDAIAGELPTAFVVKSSEIDVTEKELKDFVASTVCFRVQSQRIYKIFNQYVGHLSPIFHLPK